MNEAGNLPPFHFPILPPLPPCHLTTLALFPPCQVLTTSTSPLPMHLPHLTCGQLLTIPSSLHHSQLATSLPSLLSYLANSALHPPPPLPFLTCHSTALQPLQPCSLTILTPFPPFQHTTLPPSHSPLSHLSQSPTTVLIFPAHYPHTFLISAPSQQLKDHSANNVPPLGRQGKHM